MTSEDDRRRPSNEIAAMCPAELATFWRLPVTALRRTGMARVRSGQARKWPPTWRARRDSNLGLLIRRVTLGFAGFLTCASFPRFASAGSRRPGFPVF